MIFNLNSFTQEGGGDNNKILLYGIIVAVVFFVFIMPLIEKCYNAEKHELVEKLENLMNPIKLDTNKCSRSCCVNSGWEYPKELQPKDMTAEELKNYIPTNFSCNLGSNTGGGCVCVSKDDYEVLGSRGSNGVTGCNN
jgi:hypothetical protein